MIKPGLILVGVLAVVSLAAAEDKKGFVSLYNGKDLAGWQTTGNWLTQDNGVLMIKPRPGEKGWQRYSAYLWTARKYKDKYR